MAMGDAWRLVLALILTFMVGAFSVVQSKRERFRVYAPGAFDYTTANVQGDACPFAEDDVARAAQAMGAGAALACKKDGVGLDDAYFDDHAAPGVAAFCLEEPAKVVSPSVTDLMAHGTYGAVRRLEAPTIQALFATAQAAVGEQSKGIGATYPLLLVAQQGGYGGAYLTASRMDGFQYAPSGGSPHTAEKKAANIVGLLGVFRSMDARLAVEGALSTAYSSRSRMCEMTCAGDASKRCGCTTGEGRATCMASTIDYTDYKAPLNHATYWIAYRLQW